MNLKELIDKNPNYYLKDNIDYWRYGDWKISVTEALSLIWDSGLDFIKHKYPVQLEEACIRWNKVHQELENYWKDKTLWNSNRYKLFRKFQILNGINILEAEEIYYRGNIRGTIDAITNIWIIDYKSSLCISEKYKVQIAAYCWLSWQTKGGILYLWADDKVDKLYMSAKNKYKFIEVDVPKYLEVWEDILYLLREHIWDITIYKA